jgi:hypothetical protein
MGGDKLLIGGTSANYQTVNRRGTHEAHYYPEVDHFARIITTDADSTAGPGLLPFLLSKSGLANPPGCKPA